jgi:hypothetical protein
VLNCAAELRPLWHRPKEISTGQAHCDLRAKRLDVLLELFPWIEEALRETPAPPATDVLKAEIDSLKDLILRHNQIGNLKPLPSQQIVTPKQPDSSDDEITIKKDTSTDFAQKFLNSLLALQG